MGKARVNERERESEVPSRALAAARTRAPLCRTAHTCARRAIPMHRCRTSAHLRGPPAAARRNAEATRASITTERCRTVLCRSNRTIRRSRRRPQEVHFHARLRGAKWAPRSEHGTKITHDQQSVCITVDRGDSGTQAPEHGLEAPRTSQGRQRSAGTGLGLGLGSVQGQDWVMGSEIPHVHHLPRGSRLLC